MQRLLLALLFIGPLVCGCSDGTPSGPSPTPQVLDLAGTWRATVDIPGVPAQMTWTLAQSGAAVSGPVTIGLPTGTILLNGALTGTATSTSLTYTIAVAPGGIPTNPTCTGQLGGTVTGTARQLSGPLTVLSSTCSAPIPSTTVTLVKS